MTPADNPPGPTASQLRARVLAQLELAEQLERLEPHAAGEPLYRVMGRSGPLGQGLTLEQAQALAGVSSGAIEPE